MIHWAFSHLHTSDIHVIVNKNEYISYVIIMTNNNNNNDDDDECDDNECCVDDVDV